MGNCPSGEHGLGGNYPVGSHPCEKCPVRVVQWEVVLEPFFIAVIVNWLKRISAGVR